MDNLEARTALGTMVSKKLKEALFIAENAARGQFPSTAAIQSGLEFDYPVIHAVVVANLRMENQHKQQRKRNGAYLPKSYYARKVLPKLNKARRIQVEVQRQMQLRA